MKMKEQMQNSIITKPLNQNRMKLIKEYEDYYLISDKEIESGDEYVKLDNRPRTLLLGTTISHVTKVSKLSKQNCDEIFGIVNVEELAQEVCDDTISSPYHCYIAGFNKNAELNKDKVFTLEDLEKAYLIGCEYQTTHRYHIDENLMTLKLKQQPTEIEVEIEMEEVQEIYRDGTVKWESVPKLDSSGCLVLRKL